MLHGFASRRLFSAFPYFHSPKLSDPSIFSRRISITHHRQGPNPYQISQFPGTHIELLDFFDHFLQQCITIQQLKQIHTQIIFGGSLQSGFLAARLVSIYAMFGILTDARDVFENTSTGCNSNLLLWNSILRANVTYGEYEETLSLYRRMRNLGIWADGFTFPLVIRACAMLGDSKLCENVHCHVLQMGFQNHLHVVNELLVMYGKLGQMGEASKLFDRMVVRSQISWNTMVSGFAINHDCHGAFDMFQKMEFEGCEPNPVTWTSLLSSHTRCGLHEETLQLYVVMRNKCIGATGEAVAVVISVCVNLGLFNKGVAVHGYVIRGGFQNYSIVKNSLICLYGKRGAAKDAETLFSEMESKNLVTWNALISSYAESGLCDEAFAVFSQLQMLDGYTVLRPSVVSWSAIIGAFASKGRFDESLELFRKMQVAGVTANSVTISSVLSICAELPALRLGQEIHAFVVRGLMDINVLVGNGLINMYTKCGSLKEGHLAFEKIDGRDLISWNTMIAGYGMHGLGENAVRTFDQMTEAGYKPDGVTFVAVLSACSHVGLVTEGRKLFDQMTREFRIEPQVEHYACMVDLLGRAGFLQEASDIVKRMPMEPNDYVWGTLLNSCRMYKNTVVAEDTASQIFGLSSEMTGSYMLLSNLYAASGRWKDSARIRLSAKTRGLKKIPGQSWIEVKKKVCMFSAGHAVQMGMDEIYRILETLSLHVEMEGYVPDSIFLRQNIDLEEICISEV
ncbi:unnamed protein product [Ilex paraguariensis]|uniref:Pentatricopeptide repeat-containing protein n=1 Tax=Ilex paraguariensis TaxID=185542 RepID=A0ABC8UG39_9AQUA